jgi:hypothetical protein
VLWRFGLAGLAARPRLRYRAEHAADADRAALLHVDVLEHAGGRRRHFTLTLSVSSSTTRLVFLNGSPSRFSQRAMVASVTDSPIAGTLISMLMSAAFD